MRYGHLKRSSAMTVAAESKITIGTRGGGPECTRDSESLQLAVFWEIIAGCVQRKTSLPHTQPVSLGKRTRSFTGTSPLQVLPAPGTPRAALSSLPLRSRIVSGVPCPWPCRLLRARAPSIAWAVVPLAAEQAALCVRPPAGEESGGFQGGATVNKPLKFQVTLSLTSLEPLEAGTGKRRELVPGYRLQQGPTGDRTSSVPPGLDVDARVGGASVDGSGGAGAATPDRRALGGWGPRASPPPRHLRGRAERPLSRPAQHAPPLPPPPPPEQTQLSAGLACRPAPARRAPAPGGRRSRGGGLAGSCGRGRVGGRPLPPAPRFVMQMHAGGARPLPS
uniref:Uncharacterized protein n=1 Tax=Rangifer tarandus platyrhynchus TaxID=3082113 RepID=A0ACB0EI02_RANTA|nr:unnamed protein product [Rangifer tarandus platyrhynchus]